MKTKLNSRRVKFNIEKKSVIMVALSFLLFMAGKMQVSNVGTISKSRFFISQKIFASQMTQYIRNNFDVLNVFHNNIQLKSKLNATEIELLKTQQQLLDLQTRIKISELSDNQYGAEKVYGFSNSYHSSYMYISANQQYKQHSPVCAKDGLVGIILKLQDNKAIVKTVLDKTLNIPVMNDRNNHLIIRGNGDNMRSIIIKNESKDITTLFSIGDILKTSGENCFFNKGIPVATITSVHADHIVAKPNVSIDAINYVYITNDTCE